MGWPSVAVFGLWATYPAEPVNGVMVSDRLFTFLFKEAEPPEGVVAPRPHEHGRVSRWCNSRKRRSATGR